VESTFIQGNNGFIFEADQEKMILFFSEAVNENSFWVEQGALPGDIIKEINGKTFTIENAQMLLGGMYQWKSGQDFELKVERDGKEIVFNGKLTQAYTTKKSIMEDENATQKQIDLRKAWLKEKSKI
jgi:S1-C subfamily serine protease